jgi:hypothetical protein
MVYGSIQQVDWDAFSKASKKLPRWQQLSYCKIIHELINTNVQNSKLYNKDPSCPCCLQCPETLEHILKCQEPSIKENRMALQRTLQEYLEKIKTPQTILDTILYGLNHWEKDQAVRAPTRGSLKPLDILLTNAYTEQSQELGWNHFLRGRLSKYWGQAYTFIS